MPATRAANSEPRIMDLPKGLVAKEAFERHARGQVVEVIPRSRAGGFGAISKAAHASLLRQTASIIFLFHDDKYLNG